MTRWGTELGLGYHDLRLLVCVHTLGLCLARRRTAALNEPDADSAITNVTGSNSVNVFLGRSPSPTPLPIHTRIHTSPANVPTSSLQCCRVVAGQDPSTSATIAIHMSQPFAQVLGHHPPASTHVCLIAACTRQSIATTQLPVHMPTSTFT
jgi:hypothetical protein